VPEYSNLIAVDSGFALLRTQREVSAAGDASTIIERLVSADGATWSIDEEFLPLSASSDTLPSPTFHTAEAFGVTSISGQATAPLAVLFEQAIVGTVDLVGRNSPNDVIDCAAAIRSFGPSAVDLITVHRTGRSASSEFDSSFSSIFTPMPGGTVASFYEGNNPFLGDPVSRFSALEDCSAFPGALPETEPAAIIFISPDDTVTRVPLPRALQSIEPIRPTLLGTEDGILITLDQAVWRVDPATTIWTKVADLPTSTRGVLNFRFLDADRVLGTTDDDVVLVNLASGEVMNPDIELGRFWEVIYADNDLAILTHGVRNRITAVIDFP